MKKDEINALFNTPIEGWSNDPCEICKYKQTLLEIKEIVRQEIVCDDCDFLGTYRCDSKLCTSFYLDDFCKNLLQKISECEVEK